MIAAQKKIFVTGASGFIGKNLVKRLAESNHKVYALSRNRNFNTNDLSSKSEIVFGSLEEADRLADIIASCDYVIHIAGEKREKSKMHLTNVIGTQNLLNCIIKSHDVKFLFVSSAGIYGIRKHPEKVITENALCFPHNIYEQTKLEAEKITIKICNEASVQYCIVRPTNVFGETDPSHKLLNLFRALKHNRFIYLSHHAYVNYVYVNYVSSVIGYLVDNNIFEGKVYNINSPCKISFLIETAKSLLGINSKTLLVPGVSRPLFFLAAATLNLLPERFQALNIEKYQELTNKKVIDATNIETLTGLKAQQYLYNGIKNLVESYKEKGLL